MQPPTYQHDCEACTYLGGFDGHDLYCCAQHVLGPTVIARFGDGPAYASGLVVAEAASSPELPVTIRALRVAYLIARDRGLLP